MRKNYAHILFAAIGCFFVLLIYGLALAISFLDYEKLVPASGEEEFFASLFLNDRLLIGFAVAGLVFSALFLFFDATDHRKFAKTIKFLCSILTLVMTAYILIALLSVRDQAFALGSIGSEALALYDRYKEAAIPIVTGLMLLSICGLVRSIYCLVEDIRASKRGENNQ